MRTVEEMYDQIKDLVKEAYVQGFVDGQQDNMAFDDGLDETIHETLNYIFTDRLREILQAERDGRCVVLPCKVGDTVWRVIRNCTESEFDNCIGCYRRENGRCQPKFFEQAFSIGLYNEIGKTVFLTRADAETALSKEAEQK